MRHLALLMASILQLLLADASPAGFAFAAEGVPGRGDSWWCYDHHALINRELVKLESREITHLMLNAPRRHGKSVLTAAWFAAWWLGRHPDHEVTIACATGDLAETHGAHARDIMLRHGREYFGLEVRGGERAPANGWSIAGHKGKLHAVGRDGTLVGKGSHLLIIDDPHKGVAEAYSEVQRANVWRWWSNDAYPGRNPGGVVVVMMTRWHPDDLCGRLLKGPDAGKWRIVNLPAIAEEGDPLGRQPGEALWTHDVRGKPMFGLDELGLIQRTDPVAFAAQYLGKPIPAGGKMFSTERYRYAADRGEYFELLGEAKRLVPKSACTYFMTIDLAHRIEQRNDFTAMVVAALTPDGDLIVVHVHRAKRGIDGQWPLITGVRLAHPQVAYIAAELRGVGHGVFAMAARDRVPCKQLKADKDKALRAMPASVAYQQGWIYHLQNALWGPEFEGELNEFPGGAHDDMVDCLAYAWLEAQELAPGRVVMMDVLPGGEVIRSWDPPPEPATVGVAPPVAVAAVAAVVPDEQAHGRRGFYGRGLFRR